MVRVFFRCACACAFLLASAYACFGQGQEAGGQEVVVTTSVYRLDDGRSAGIDEWSEACFRGRSSGQARLLDRLRSRRQSAEPPRAIPRSPVRLPKGEYLASGAGLEVRPPVFHAGHDCPSCGQSQYVIERFLPSGEHVHTCPKCRTSWRHETGVRSR